MTEIITYSACVLSADAQTTTSFFDAASRSFKMPSSLGRKLRDKAHAYATRANE